MGVSQAPPRNRPRSTLRHQAARIRSPSGSVLMHRRHSSKQSTRGSSNVIARHKRDPLAANVWTTLREIALAGWASTARLALLLLVKQGTAGIVILLIMRR